MLLLLSRSLSLPRSLSAPSGVFDKHFWLLTVEIIDKLITIQQLCVLEDDNAAVRCFPAAYVTLEKYVWFSHLPPSQDYNQNRIASVKFSEIFQQSSHCQQFHQQTAPRLVLLFEVLPENIPTRHCTVSSLISLFFPFFCFHFTCYKLNFSPIVMPFTHKLGDLKTDNV